MNNTSFFRWFIGSEIPIPPPPYAVFSEDGVNVLNFLNGFTYSEGTGPSNESATFGLFGDGLLPASDNITITFSGSNFEIYDPNTSTWKSTTFTVPYTGGSINQSGYKVRMKSGLAENSYTGTITVTGPNSAASVLTCSGVVSAPVYTSIMTDYLTRLAAEGGSLTSNEKQWLNTFTQNADVAAGEFDRLWITGLSNNIASRISLVNALTTDLLTEVNSPTWTAYEGYQGNGSTQALDTNYNAYTQGVKYTLNSANYFVYITNNVGDVAATPIGSYTDANYIILYPYLAGSQYPYINSLAIDRPTGVPNSSGLRMVKRTSSTNCSHYNNGALLSNFTIASTSVPNCNNWLLAAYNGSSIIAPSTYKISISGFGSGNVDAAQFYTDVQTLGTHLGWAV